MKSINRRSSLIKAFAISLLIPLFVTGCERKQDREGYHGLSPELYSIAIDSVLGTRGHVVDDRADDIEITVMERDQYGRSLYLYNEHRVASGYSLLISQKRTDEYTYYYPDYNFISAPENSFPEEEIEELKRKNDWNKEINLDKCKKIDIVVKRHALAGTDSTLFYYCFPDKTASSFLNSKLFPVLTTYCQK